MNLGLNGALICTVDDDISLLRSTPTGSLTFNRANLPTFETPRRVERVVPPMGFWNTYGISKFLFYLLNIISFLFFYKNIF